MYLVITTSLHPDSRSRILSQEALMCFDKAEIPAELIDIRDLDLPACDGDSCYANEDVQLLAEKIRVAPGVIIASPIYNYDVSSTAKNLIELTGQAWKDKVVGFTVAAGGQSSYMSVIGIANSLMLDFRAIIIPRFVYATDVAFRGDALVEDKVIERTSELVTQMIRVASALTE